ncbi:MAG: cytochrome c3 family protein [Xanthobacteraceae bacterium]
MSRTTLLWLLWISLTASVGIFALVVILYGGNRAPLLIGRTTDGHYQIELACDACHTSAFGGGELLQQACLKCHGAALKAENDSHPKSKFTDPRNADRVAVLDAQYCVTCHQEHRPGVTHAMGVTLPNDFCFLCHYDVADDRPSHKGLQFTTCASAGCHHFHDNRALYSDFLVKHQGEKDQLDAQVVVLADWLKQKEGRIDAPRVLLAADADAPSGYRTEAAVAAWSTDVHARAGVNCKGCHATKAEPAAWIAAPGLDSCKGCHADQARTFIEGKHGMRLREGMLATRDGPLGLFHKTALPPMRPTDARLPMKPAAAATTLGCNTCHSAHVYDIKKAQAEACALCHDDGHTKAYFTSPHYDLFLKEQAGELPKGGGVSCATCHMPVVAARNEDGERIFFVTHDQNDNLRPNEKMVRGVCGYCHGLQFTLDALADPALAARNFKGHSTVHIESIEWAQRRVRERGAARSPARQ